jgi:hypothetical protein
MINKITGLEDKHPKKNTGVKINKISGKPDALPSYDRPSESRASRIGTFSEHELGTLTPGAVSTKEDAFELRAMAQDTSEKWANGALKAGITGLGAFTENTLGIAAGLINLAQGESFSDTGLGRSIDGWNEWA